MIKPENSLVTQIKPNMAGSHKRPLLLLLIFVVNFAHGVEQINITTAKPMLTYFEVKTCPKVKTLKNVDKNRLLGVWFAYATTPLDTPLYQRRCASYNVENSPYFKTNILFTDYKHFLITYACNYNNETKLHNIKVRVLTRTRTPIYRTLMKAMAALEANSIPTEKLHYLKTQGFCFEWYILQYHQQPRPGTFNMPINTVWDHR